MDYYAPAVDVTDPLSRLPQPSAWISKGREEQAEVATRFAGLIADSKFSSGRTRVVAVSGTGPTSPFSEKSWSIEDDPTTFIGETIPAAPQYHGAAELREAIESTASRRIKVLAVQYASAHPSQEILARMEILDARMNKYSPRVTRAREEHLNRSMVALAHVSDDLDEIDRLLMG